MLSNLIVVADRDFKKDGPAIGSGSYGEVFRGQDVRQTPARPIAVKVLKEPIADFEHTKAFIRELSVMASLHHPGTLELIGFTFPSKPDERIQILTPLMENGTVDSAVKKERKAMAPPGWNGTAKSRVVFGVAAIMDYMHAQGFIHRDLKTENVFLNGEFEPVIADFGLSRVVDITMTMAVGSPVYMAPELYSDDNDDQYGGAVDVYAYGVLLYQMFTDSLALDDADRPIRSSQQLMMRVLKGARLKRVPGIPDFFWELITSCWQQKPGDRPRFADILEVLRAREREWIFPGTDLDALHEYEDRISPKGISLADLSDDDEEDEELPPSLYSSMRY